MSFVNLIMALNKIVIESDFKTVKQKFIKQGISQERVNETIDAFKELRDGQKIKAIDEKNIDFWGKKSWEDFKSFVDKTKKEKSATETKKLKKMAGAELVAENEGWYVYHITTHEACKIYGSGTKWCITESDGEQWKSYSSEYNIYFILSKKLSKEKSDFYKIAVTVDLLGELDFWDSLDTDRSSVPSRLKIPKYNFKEFDLNEKSEEVQINAVKVNPYTIEHIKSPSEVVQLEAVKHSGFVIQYIQNPSETVQLEAVRENLSAIQYIADPSEAMQLQAIRENESVIQYIDKPSEAVQLEAVKENGFVIQYIQNPSETVQLEAVKQNGSAIEYIENPSEAVQLQAVKDDGNAIMYINNPSEKVQLQAVKTDGAAIRHIINPPEKVQLQAVKNNIRALQFIKKPTDRVKKLFNKEWNN